MRFSLVVSAIVHFGILAAALVSLPDAGGYEPSPVTALPVELIEITDETDIREGEVDAEAVLEEPADAATVEAEAPAETAPGLANTPEEGAPNEERANDLTAEASAPEPGGAPELLEEPVPPDPRPEMTVAALPEEAEPEVTPAPEAASAPEEAAPEEAAEAPPAPRTAPALPRARPTPPPRPVREARRAAPTEETFDADRISQLINRADTSGGGDGAGRASLGERTGRQAARMTLSELDSLRAQMERCWNPPVGALGAENLAVKLIVKFNPDGSVRETPNAAVVSPTPAHLAAAESARRAVLACQPYTLPPEKYDLWKEVQVTFDPRTLY